MKVYKNLSVPNIQQDCRVWKKTQGFLGEFKECSRKIKMNKLDPVWQVTYPGPDPRCWSTVKKGEDPRCHMTVPGFDHPHVVMVDDYQYALQLELL